MTTTVLNPLSSVAELFKTPFRPAHLFSEIPEPCLHSAVLHLINLVRAASKHLPPAESHAAFTTLYLFPTAVLRRTFRGELAWRLKKGQMFALKERICRTSAGQWSDLCYEAIDALNARDQWDKEYKRPRRKNANSSNFNESSAMRLASEGQYSRAMRSLLNDPIADTNSEEVLSRLQALHSNPMVPVQPISQANLPRHQKSPKLKSSRPHARLISPRLLGRTVSLRD